MKSRDVWALISKKLKETNPEWKKTAIQCDNKWKDIKRKYMETKDYNNTSENDPKICKFYEELDEILGEKLCVKPIAVASNLNRKRMNISSEEQNDLDEINEDSSSSIQNENKAPQRKRRKMTRLQQELKDWSAALLADAKAREAAKERRHRETIVEIRATIDAYKDIMSKLIEKL